MNSIVVQFLDNGLIRIDFFGRFWSVYTIDSLTIQQFTELIRFINYDVRSDVFPV